MKPYCCKDIAIATIQHNCSFIYKHFLITCQNVSTYISAKQYYTYKSKLTKFQESCVYKILISLCELIWMIY